MKFIQVIFYWFLVVRKNDVDRFSLIVKVSRQKVSIVEVVSNSVETNFKSEDICIVLTWRSMLHFARASAILFRLISSLPLSFKLCWSSYMSTVYVFLLKQPWFLFLKYMHIIYIYTIVNCAFFFL